jgi:uncharacterized protein YfiM (DUF2279 family)
MTDPDTTTTPIVVNATPVPAAIATLMRQALIAICATAVAKGWLGQDLADQLIPIAIALGTIAYGQVKTWVLHRSAATMASILPDSIATTK